jgi:hypothetical protein
LAIEPPAGTHRREYDPATAEVVLGAAAALIRAVGFASQHMILIGGLVPGLLVPELDPGVEPHIGTADLDVCLSVALMEGTTGEYEKIQQSLKRAGFQPTDQSWRWRGGTALFFCPQPEGVPPGTVFRPPAARWRARANLGSQLGALTLAAGGLIGQDVEEVEREVVLPGGKGRSPRTPTTSSGCSRRGRAVPPAPRMQCGRGGHSTTAILKGHSPRLRTSSATWTGSGQ